MSRRKKMTLGDALEALKDLPRVLKALEVLNGEQEKVRALMGKTSPSPMVSSMTWEWRDAQGRQHSAPVAGYGAATIVEPTGTLAPSNPILDTPERREYEAAKKAGSVVPDPFAGISPAQRERMEEQRALVERLRASRGGTPAPGGPSGHPMGAPSPAEVARVVGTEELEQSANGSAGAEVQSGGFTDG